MKNIFFWLLLEWSNVSDNTLEPRRGIESRSLRKERFRGQHDWPFFGNQLEHHL